MLFKDLNIGDYFTWNGILHQKIRSTTSNKPEALLISNGYCQNFGDKISELNVIRCKKDGSPFKVCFSDMEIGQWFIAVNCPYQKISRYNVRNCIGYRDGYLFLDTVSDESYFVPCEKPFKDI